MAMGIGIIGAGAIGYVVRGLLTRAGHDVRRADQWPAPKPLEPLLDLLPS